jgi:hypothetical protein
VLTVSDQVMAAFQGEGLQSLRARILSHWGETLKTTGDRAGPDIRNAVLGDVETIARDDTSLTYADLTMLADLMLVDRATIPARR